eukprot:3013089-Amphidinium_carterae.2
MSHVTPRTEQADPEDAHDIFQLVTCIEASSIGDVETWLSTSRWGHFVHLDLGLSRTEKTTASAGCLFQQSAGQYREDGSHHSRPCYSRVKATSSCVTQLA